MPVPVSWSKGKHQIIRPDEDLAKLIRLEGLEGRTFNTFRFAKYFEQHFLKEGKRNPTVKSPKRKLNVNNYKTCYELQIFR